MIATLTAAIAFDFISARIAAARCTGKETAILLSVESPWGRLTRRRLRRPVTRSGRNGCTHGSACRKGWITTSRADRLPHGLETRHHALQSDEAPPPTSRHCL